MVDARGYSCPMPVVMVQKEVSRSAPDQLEVLVDDAARSKIFPALPVTAVMR